MTGAPDSGPARFPATRVSLIEALGAPDPAVRLPAYEALVGVYWKPVYKYLRVARRFDHDDAEDLTQDFFARAFEKDSLASFDPSIARFRTFLRVCLDRFAANAVKARGRLKRGGGQARVSLDPAELETIAADATTAADPEVYFRREWVRALFEGALEAVSADYRGRGKDTQLAVFLAYDIEPPDDGRRPKYDELAARFGVPVTQITNYLAAARRAFRREALERLRAVTGSDEEFAAEARELFGVDAA
ncbi:MAG: sigma-70 family RNA polymerase sigma factor [Gemmatimonadales bacterium]|nr:sigma-70 family RNA polymerase sigma factor [Gemmatimonadales bacterium]